MELNSVSNGNRKVDFANRGPYAEIYTKGPLYSFLEEDTKGNLKSKHPSVRCKDFLTDIIWSETIKSKASIYGFTWENTGTFLKDTMIIGMDNEKNDVTEYAPSLMSLLNKLEERLGFDKKSVVEVDSTGKILVIKFNVKWTKIPHLFSFFTLILRVGCSYDGSELESFFNSFAEGKYKTIGSNDVMYVRNAKSNITNLLKGIIREQKYENYTTIHNIHNNSGIVNFK